MSRIRTLPENLINLIAAGEVVERPASAVKELLENSIDAESTSIILRVEDSGKTLIEVEDNGIGMDEEDALKAFEQHATSKIADEKDLLNIVTLGFRGEALASISSVADSIIIESRSESTPSVKFTIKNTEKTKDNSSREDRGTNIKIQSLFKNIPARLKFLKSDATELKYITTTFTDIALSHLNIRFEMFHNGKLLYRLPITTSLKDRIFDIYGKNIAESLFEIVKFDGKSYQIEALFCRPELAKKSSPIQYISLNGRSINSKIISVAIQQAYQGYIHKDLKPFYFLFIHIDPAVVDVNVHPRKLEVRFENQDQIFKDIFRMTRNTLEQKTKINVNLEREEETSEAQIRENTISQPRQSINTESTYKSPVSRPKEVNDAMNFSKLILSETTTYFETKPVESRVIEIRPFQIFNTYIVFEQENKFTFIDQHAAAEKILFEKILFSSDHIKTKPLLVPEIVELKAEDKNIVLNKTNDFKKLGIIIEDFGGNDVQILELPEMIEKLDGYKYIEEIIHNKDDFSSLANEYAGVELSSELYYLVALTACHGSIRAGQKLSEQEMLQIINSLPTLRNPQSCPHGRPIRWVVSRSEIEKNFKRII